MKEVFRIIVLTAVFIITSAFTSSKLSPIDGQWSGEFKGNAGTLPFQTRFWTENGEIKGTIDFPSVKVYRKEISWILIETDIVHFEVPNDSEVLVFEGILTDNKLIGEFKAKTDRGTFNLIRP
jgi:hypothetical protein